MAFKSKYVGKVYDGIWLVEKCETVENRCYYTVVNQFNGFRYRLAHSTILKLDRGETDMGKIIHQKIKLGNGRTVEWLKLIIWY